MASRAVSYALLGSILTLPSMCNVYKSDLTKLCDAEQLSGESLRGSRPALLAWMGKVVASSQAVIFVRDLGSKDTKGIGLALRDEARKAGLSSCALADTCDAVAKQEDFANDLSNLCAGTATRSDGSIARLDISEADDGERARELNAWTALNAKSPDTAPLVERVLALPSKQRGTALRAEVAKVGITNCPLSVALDTPPPALVIPAPSGAYPTYKVSVDASNSKNDPVIAGALVSQDASLSVNGCYQTLLVASPTAKGTIVEKLSFDAAGHIDNAIHEKESTLKGQIDICVDTALRTLTVPGVISEGKKGSKATVVFILAPTAVGPGFTASIEHASGGGGRRHR